MSAIDKTRVTVATTVNAPLEKAWNYWTAPEHIVKWNHASSDWHTPHAQNDLRTGGKFSFRMESRDGKMGFDFAGEYNEVVPNKTIDYTMGDGRTAKVDFESAGDKTKITQSFDAENENPVEYQQSGWQAIMDNFKTYVETS